MVLVFEAVTKRFGSTAALDRFSFEVRAGELVALTGPNGSGKTTALRIAATLLSPTSGRVSIAGLDPGEEGAKIRARIGYVGDRPHLEPALTIEENLRFFGRAHGLSGTMLSQRVEAVLEEFDLTGARDSAVAALSRGMAQRAAIARALLHEPPLLLLDEASAHLDERGADALLSALRARCAAGTSVVCSTHSGDFAASCNRRIALVAGKHRSPSLAEAYVL